MPNFQEWAKLSPQNQSTAAALSQFVMRHDLTQRTTVDQLFAALKNWTAQETYNEGADNLSVAIHQKIWNCVSLSRLLVVTYCLLMDQNPNLPIGVQERRVDSRKLSAPGTRASIRSLLPNVRRPDAPGEQRYTFSGHTWVMIGGAAYDLLMGTTRNAVGATFPVDVVQNAERVMTCQLPAPAGVAPVAAAVPGGNPAHGHGMAPPPPGAGIAGGQLATYWLRPSGQRVGPLPEFELVRA